MTDETLHSLESVDALCAATIEALTEIWQHVLQRTDIGPEDEFHDLGGNDPTR